MSGGPYQPPNLRGNAPFAVPVLRVPSPVAPAMVRSVALGPIGPAGQKGDLGPQGAPGDYGSIRYDEVNATPITLTPGVPAAFTLAAPVTNTDSLRGPFAGFVFLSPDGSTLNARASGDSYLIRARGSVLTSIAGGSFTTDLVIPTVSGPSSTRPRTLMKAAGTPDLVDELFQAFPGKGFLDNGATIMVTSTVPAVLTPQTLFVTPLSAV
ncbi:hypothetical protein ACQKQD_18615 [Methylobacterium sp. NPDC080182]|uniref:hypothetical protein n=1 Tax=Methylobacterium sp. NPDC080182 TaxID=3390590 RepID=UPI003D087D07